MFAKQHILTEITRTAKTNGGAPLGWRKFEAETGIKPYDWGRYWSRWSDAQVEAGVPPNKLTAAFGDEALFGFAISLVRELGKFPTIADIRVKHERGSGFPHDRVFHRRFGGQAQFAAALLQHCRGRPGHSDIADACESWATMQTERPAERREKGTAELGYVYLLRSGRYFKIGKSNAVGRREREIAIQMPEPAGLVHSITTDDPAGIEGYWHRRFADKRKNGEWFALSNADVHAFKRRKFM